MCQCESLYYMDCTVHVLHAALCCVPWPLALGVPGARHLQEQRPSTKPVVSASGTLTDRSVSTSRVGLGTRQHHTPGRDGLMPWHAAFCFYALSLALGGGWMRQASMTKMLRDILSPCRVADVVRMKPLRII